MVKAYEIAEELNSLGIKTIVSSDIRRYVCLKAIVNAAINPLTAILKVRNGDLLKTEQARKLVETINGQPISSSWAALATTCRQGLSFRLSGGGAATSNDHQGRKH